MVPETIVNLVAKEWFGDAEVSPKLFAMVTAIGIAQLV